MNASMATGPASQRPGAVLRAWFLGALAAGAFFRLYHFLFQRSLWMDEAILAINIPARSLSGFLTPMDYNTSAPVPFLWGERLLVALFGASELSLRAVPLLAGIAVVALTGVLGGRLFGSAGASAAVALAALSPTLIRFANEVKPYGTDALVTVLILGAALRVARQPGRRDAWIAFAVVGVLGILSSYPAVFVGAAALVSLLFVAELSRQRLAALGVCCIMFASAFAIPYLAIYRAAASSPELQGAWNAAFLTPGAQFVEQLRLALPGLLFPAFAGNGATAPALGFGVALAAIALAAWGLVEAGRRHGGWAVVQLAGPIAFAALASAFRRYPFGVPRLMVFAVPALILMVAGALAAAHRILRGRVPDPLLLMGLLLALSLPAWYAVSGIRAPFEGEDARTLVSAYREARRGEHEPVYIGARAIPAWVFYSTNWASPKLERLAYYAKAASHGLAFENRPSRGRPVENEGFDLVYEFRGRRELLGIATGVEWRWPSYTKSEPDPGWAWNEAKRIREEAGKNAANRCAWVLLTRLSEHASRPLTWQLRESFGGKRDFEKLVPGGVLYRYCFAGDVPPPRSR